MSLFLSDDSSGVRRPKKCTQLKREKFISSTFFFEIVSSQCYLVSLCCVEGGSLHRRVVRHCNREKLEVLVFSFLKLRHYEKATKFEKDIPSVLTEQLFLLSSVKTSGRFFKFFGLLRKTELYAAGSSSQAPQPDPLKQSSPQVIGKRKL